MVTIVTLLAPRLLINLRQECYTPDLEVDPGAAVVPGRDYPSGQQTLTWDACQPNEALRTSNATDEADVNGMLSVVSRPEYVMDETEIVHDI